MADLMILWDGNIVYRFQEQRVTYSVTTHLVYGSSKRLWMHQISVVFERQLTVNLT